MAKRDKEREQFKATALKWEGDDAAPYKNAFLCCAKEVVMEAMKRDVKLHQFFTHDSRIFWASWQWSDPFWDELAAELANPDDEAKREELISKRKALRESVRQYEMEREENSGMSDAQLRRNVEKRLKNKIVMDRFITMLGSQTQPDAGSDGSRELTDRMNHLGFPDPVSVLNPNVDEVNISLGSTSIDELFTFLVGLYPKSGGLQSQRALSIIFCMMDGVCRFNNYVPERIEDLMCNYQVGYKKAGIVCNTSKDRVCMDHHLFCLFAEFGFVDVKINKKTKKAEPKSQHPESQAEAWIDPDTRPLCNNVLVTICQMLQRGRNGKRKSAENLDVDLLATGIQILKDIHASDKSFHPYVERWRVRYNVSDEEWGITGPSTNVFRPKDWEKKWPKLQIKSKSGIEGSDTGDGDDACRKMEEKDKWKRKPDPKDNIARYKLWKRPPHCHNSKK